MKLRLPIKLQEMLIAAFVAVTLSSGISSAAPDGISINFWSGTSIDGADGSISGEDTAGVAGVQVAGKNWTNLTAAQLSGGAITNIATDNNGSATGISISATGYLSTWGPGSAQGATKPTTQNGHVQASYLDVNGTNQVYTVTISDLPYLVSNVYLLMAGDGSATGSGVNDKYCSMTVNGVQYRSTAEGTVAGTGNWGQRTVNQTEFLEGSNMLAISGVTGTTITVSNNNGQTGRGTLAGIQVTDGYTGTYLYRTTAAGTGNWSDSLWATTEGGAANTAWNNTGHAAVITANTAGSTLTVAEGTSVDGIILKAGTLTLTGADLTVTNTYTFNVLEGAILNLGLGINSDAALNWGGKGKAVLQQDLTLLKGLSTGSSLQVDLNGHKLTMGSADSRLAMGQYTWNMTGGEGSELHLYLLNDQSHTNITTVSMGSSTGPKDIYVNGVFALNRNESSTISSIGTSTLHLSAGSTFMLRNGISNTTTSIFNNDIIVDSTGTVIFQAYGSVKGIIGSNITSTNPTPDFQNGITLKYHDSGEVYFTGNINYNSGFLIDQGIVHLSGTSNLGGLLVRDATLHLESGANVTAQQFVLSEGTSAGTNGNIQIKDGASLTITGNKNGDTTGGYAYSILLGHWPGTGTLNMSGGTFTATAAQMYFGWDGDGKAILTGGEMTLLGMNFATARGHKGQFYLGAQSGGAGTGILKLGAAGISGLSGAEGTAQLTLGDGTIGATANWSTNLDADNNKAIQVVGTTGTKFASGNFDITINHALAGAGNVIVDNAGTGSLILAGSNSAHTGNLIVKNGLLKLAATNAASNRLGIYRGAQVTGTAAGFTLERGSGSFLNVQGASGTATVNSNLAMSGGTFTLDFNSLADGPNNAAAYLAVTGSMTFTGTSYFSLTGDFILGTDSIALGKYFLASATAISGWSDSFSSQYLNSNIGSMYSYAVTKEGDNLYLTVNEAGESLVWNNAAGGMWDTTPTNWKGATSGDPLPYRDNAVLSFEDMAASSISVNVNGDFTPAIIHLNNASTVYSFTGDGSLLGVGKINKAGTGDVIMGIDNSSYTGVIELAAGKLIAAHDNALGQGNIAFEGGVLGLESSVIITKTTGDFDAKFDVQEGKTGAITGIAGSGLLAKNMVISNNGTLTITGPTGAAMAGTITASGSGTTTFTAASFSGAATTSGTGSLTLVGASFTGNLTANDTSTITMKHDSNSFTYAGILKGTIIAKGTVDPNIANSGTMTLTQAAFNGASGHLIIDGGILSLGAAGVYNATGGLDITLKNSGILHLAYGAGVTSTGTLTMESGTTLRMVNGAGSSNTFNMNIVLDAEGGRATIGGSLYGNNSTLRGKISGTGDLYITKYEGNNIITFNTGWVTNSYVGNTMINAANITYNIGSGSLDSEGTVKAWGTGDVTVGGATGNTTTLTFSGLPSTDYTHYTVNNNIKLASAGQGTTFSLFAGASALGILNGKLTVERTSGSAAILLSVGEKLRLAGGIAGSASFTIGMKAPDEGSTSRILELSGDNSGFSSYLTINNASNTILGSATNKTFGGTIGLNSGQLSLGAAGQTIGGNLNMAATSTFFFDAAQMTADSSTPLLSITGNLAIADNSVITIDNTGDILLDGNYILLNHTGTLTGSFDQNTINWINEPGEGSWTLTYNNKTLSLLLFGSTNQLWAGTGGSGSGTWQNDVAGWGVNGADVYRGNTAVTFANMDGVTDAQVTLGGTVSPSTINVNNSSTTYTWKGTGIIADGTEDTSPLTTLIKMGTGELIIANTDGVDGNTFSGGTTIDGGKITLQSVNALGTGDVTIKANAILNLAATDDLVNSATTINFAGGQLTYSGDAAQDVSAMLHAATADAVIKVALSGNQDVTWNTALNTLNGAVTKSGAKTLAGSLTGDLAKALTISSGAMVVSLTDAFASSGSLSLDKLAGAGNLTLNGGSGATLAGTAIGLTGNLAVNGTYTLANASALNSVSQLSLGGTLTLGTAGTISPALNATTASTIKGANGNSYTLSGALTGSALTFGAASGTTTFALTGDLANYSSSLTADAGTTVILSTSLNAATTLAGNGTFAANYAADTTWSKALSGATSLTQMGNGKLTINSANTGTGTLTINSGKTVELANGGTWNGAITGNGGHLIANYTNATDLTLTGLTGTATLEHKGANQVILNNSNASAYTGNISVTGGGTLNLSGKAYANQITINSGSLAQAAATTGDLIVNVTKAGTVNLGGASGSHITHLETQVGGVTVTGMTGDIALDSAKLVIDTANLSATDGSSTGTAIIRQESASNTLTLDSLHLGIAENTCVYLTNSDTRGEYAIMITNGKLAGDVLTDLPNNITFDRILNQVWFNGALDYLEYDFVEVVDGSIVINGTNTGTPYHVFDDPASQPNVITSPNALNRYTYLWVDTTLTVTLGDDEVLLAKELTGNYTNAQIVITNADTAIELNNDATAAGTQYKGNFSGNGGIIKTGQYEQEIGVAGSSTGGSIQIGGGIDVREGSLLVHGLINAGGLTIGDAADEAELTTDRDAAITGMTLIGDNGAWDMGGNLTTGALEITSGGTLNITKSGGAAITLNGGSGTLVSTIADDAVIEGNGGTLLVDNGSSLVIGTNVDLGGLALSLGNGWNLATGTDITLSGISGDNRLTLNDDATVTLNIGGSQSTVFNGSLMGAGTILKTGSGTQTLMSNTSATGIDIDVEGGEMILSKNQSSSQAMAYGSLDVGSGSKLTITDSMTANSLHLNGPSQLVLGADNPAAMGNAVSLTVSGDAWIGSGSTISTVIPTTSGSIIASGSIYLPQQATLNLVNNGTFSFDVPPADLVVMAAGNGFKWTETGSAIAGGASFDTWTVTLDKSIATFYSDVYLYMSNDGASLLATPILRKDNPLLPAAQTDNAMAGANLLWSPGLQTPGSNLDNLLNAVVDDMNSGNYSSASRKLAASAGTSYMGLLSGLQASYRYQQNLIRNRLTTMGLNQDYVYDDMPLFNAWIQGNGAYDKLNSDGDKAGHEFNSWGGTVGFDMNLTERWTAGAAFTASYGDIKSDCADSMKGDLDMYYVNIFAKYLYKSWSHSFILTGAWGEADVDRTVNYGSGYYTGHGKSDATSYGAMYELTYDIALNEDKTAFFQPLFNASIVKNNIDGFSETGAGNAGLQMGKLDAVTGTVSLGGRLMGLFGNNLFGREALGELRVQVLQDMGPSSAGGDVAYIINPGLTQHITGSKIGKTGVQFGAGLNIPVAEQGTLYFDGNVDLRNRATSVNASVGYRYNF